MRRLTFALVLVLAAAPPALAAKSTPAPAAATAAAPAPAPAQIRAARPITPGVRLGDGPRRPRFRLLSSSVSTLTQVLGTRRILRPVERPGLHRPASLNLGAVRRVGTTMPGAAPRFVPPSAMRRLGLSFELHLMHEAAH